MRENYRNLLAMALEHRRLFVIGFLVVVVASFGLAPFLGSNFFPSVDSGQITLHVRPPVGTRIETASAMFADVEKKIRETIPPSELSSIVDNIGLPTSINTVYNNSGMIGYQDGDIFVSLTAKHHPDRGLREELRKTLPEAFPGATFSFLPADIISQILNFGTPRPARRADRRPQPAGRHGLRHRAAAPRQGHPRRRRRAHPAVDGQPAAQDRGRPLAHVPAWPDRAGRDQQRGHLPGRQLAGGADLLAEPEERRPPIPIVAQMPEYQVSTLSGLQNIRSPARRPACRCWAASARSAASRRAPWSPTTTSSPWSTSTPRPRAATSARWRPT
ncbi:MAG: efflux RND transporter permease subunit [Caulobacteraceae bacterium]